jgi:hypothetical protein
MTKDQLEGVWEEQVRAQSRANIDAHKKRFLYETRILCRTAKFGVVRPNFVRHAHLKPRGFFQTCVHAYLESKKT